MHFTRCTQPSLPRAFAVFMLVLCGVLSLPGARPFGSFPGMHALLLLLAVSAAWRFGPAAGGLVAGVVIAGAAVAFGWAGVAASLAAPGMLLLLGAAVMLAVAASQVQRAGSARLQQERLAADKAVQPLQQRDVGIIGGMSGMHFYGRDIPERMQALATLRSSEAQLRLALEAGGYATWEWSAGSDELKVSSGLPGVFGIAGTATPLRRCDLLAQVHDEDKERVQAAFQQALDAAAPYRVEYRIHDQGGATRWIESRGKGIADSQGLPARIIGIAGDITDRKAEEQELLLGKSAADAANAAKSTFLAHISHEIRAPLSAILGFSEFLLDHGQSPADRSECVQTIRRNGDVLARLIDDILDLSKIEAGRLEIERLNVHVKDLLDDVAANFGLLARERGIGLSVAADGTLPARIVTDPMRLRQVLSNVVGNAIKFTERGHVCVTVRQESTGSGGRLAFEITDSGAGLTAEQQQRLFHPFGQADATTSRKYGGTGLGLVLSRRIAQALGGDLVLRSSAPGHGSTFAFWVDLALGGEHAVPAGRWKRLRPSVPHVAQDMTLLRGAQVLVVEDSPDNQLLVSRLLRQVGVEVVLAGNGVEGVEKALGSQWDLVLMDIQLGSDIDGYEATQRLRQQGFTAPIVALTAHALVDERQRILASGFDAHLAKPIDRRQLFETVLSFVQPRAAAAPGAQVLTDRGSAADMLH